MKLSHAVLLTMLLGPGCAHAPRSYVFSTPRPNDEVLDLLASSLSQRGHKVSRVDRRNAEITTYWEDTGYRWRETEDLEDETNIFLRFHVEMSNVGIEHQVSVRADVQRCVPYRAIVTPTEVLPTCLKMKGMLPTHQKVVDDLGQYLSAALSAPPKQSGPSVVRRGS